MRILLSLLLLATCATAADNKDDPGGWTQAKWGMTDTEILQAFGGDATRLSPPEKLVSGIQINIGIEQIEIGGVKFKALMIPDTDGRLKSVLLNPRKGEEQDASLFTRLQDLLVQKYGRPWLSTAEHTTDAQWTLPTTVITLTMMTIVTKLMPDLQFCTVTLKYAHKTDAPI